MKTTLTFSFYQMESKLHPFYTLKVNHLNLASHQISLLTLHGIILVGTTRYASILSWIANCSCSITNFLETYDIHLLQYWCSNDAFIQHGGMAASSLNNLPRGIIEPRSDLELKPLWTTSSSKSEVKVWCLIFLGVNILISFTFPWIVSICNPLIMISPHLLKVSVTFTAFW